MSRHFIGPEVFPDKAKHTHTHNHKLHSRSVHSSPLNAAEGKETVLLRRVATAGHRRFVARGCVRTHAIRGRDPWVRHGASLFERAECGWAPPQEHSRLLIPHAGIPRRRVRLVHVHSILDRGGGSVCHNVTVRSVEFPPVMWQDLCLCDRACAHSMLFLGVFRLSLSFTVPRTLLQRPVLVRRCLSTDSLKSSSRVK